MKTKSDNSRGWRRNKRGWGRIQGDGVGLWSAYLASMGLHLAGKRFVHHAS